jgi:hypothetical protein
VYPKFNAYKVVGDLMIFYAGAEEELQQNSYMNFANENLYLHFGYKNRTNNMMFCWFKGKIVTCEL